MLEIQAEMCYDTCKSASAKEGIAVKSLEPNVAQTSEYFNFTPSTLAQVYLLHVLCTGDFCYEPGYELKRNSYDGLLLEIILDGQVNIETEGESHTARAGQVVLIDSTKPHRYHSQTGWRALWVHFDGPAARGYMSLIHRQNGRVFSTHRRRAVQEALQDLYRMFSEQQPLSETQMALLLTQALTAMAEPAAVMQDRYGLIDQAVTCISRSIGREPTVAELARRVGLSEYHFIRVFREVMGVTPGQYIIGARMNHAKYLLRTTALPIAEIGGMVGYVSESMFSAAFRRTQGVTPRQYRFGEEAQQAGGNANDE